MIHPIRRAKTALNNRRSRRPDTPPQNSIANPLAGDTNATDPAARPADGYPHHYVPIPHILPTGEPNRGDELLWVETEIARHAAAGTLDEGTAHLLDATIDARLTEWHHAIDAAAARRRHVGAGLHATQRHYLSHTQAQLATALTAHATAATENAHWRRLLTGRPALPTPSDHHPHQV
jgi:hypothetical protein